MRNYKTSFIKWAGGKARLTPELIRRFPKEGFDTYYEPFVGGGALFFNITTPSNAVLSDLNPELINTYSVIKNDCENLITELLNKSKYDIDNFYTIRALDRNDDFCINNSEVERAARFIFLNRTCFNGLHRVNSKGQFNVPKGRYKTPTICAPTVLRRCSENLKTATLHCCSYNDKLITDKITTNDLVYLDPPYIPLDNMSFTSYTKFDFKEEDQMALCAYCKQLDNKGIKFMLSQSDTEFTYFLYDSFNIDVVLAPRVINSKGVGRGNIKEVIIRNFE